jgi:hypothetical protein
MKRQLNNGSSPPEQPAAPSITKWAHTHPMSNTNRGIKTYWQDDKSGQQWRMEIYHSKGGMIYISNKQEAKGIKLSVRPVELSKLNGLLVESSTLLGIGSGYKMHIEDAPRLNRKKMEAMAEAILRPDHPQTAALIDAIIYEQETGRHAPQPQPEEQVEETAPRQKDDTPMRANPMLLLTKQNRKDLPPLYSHDEAGAEMQAVVKFFHPMSSWRWYAGEFDGQDIFNGVVSGHFVEYGCFSLSELQNVVILGMGIERDRHFAPRPMTEVYEALWKGRIP